MRLRGESYWRTSSLQVMGCSGLLEKPWGFKDDRIVKELLDGVSNEFDNSIRGQPIRWTEECWREVYHFSKGGGGLAGRKDEYVKDVRKTKSPEKKNHDEVMTSLSKGESGSEREEVPILDLHQRMGQEALSPDQEMAGFLTPKMNK
jgi:hypothetical protein